MPPFCTVQELMVIEPVRQATVIGGWRGRDNRVSRVITAGREAGDAVADYLVIIRQEGQLQATEAILTAYLHAAVAAILFIGQETALLSCLAALAEEQQIPLLAIAKPVEEQEIIFALDLAITLKAGNRLLDFAGYMDLKQFSAVGADLPPLLDKLAAYLQNPVILVNPVFRIISSSTEQTQLDHRDQEKLINLVRHQYRGKAGEAPLQISLNKPELLPGGSVSCFVNPLLRAGKIYGYLLAVAVFNRLTPLDVCRIRETGLLCLQVLVQRNAIEDTEKKYQEHFLYDLLYNNFVTEESLIQRARYWDWDFSTPQQILIIEPDDFPLLTDKAGVLRNLQMNIEGFVQPKYRQVIVTEQQGQIVLIIGDSRDSGMKAKQQWLSLGRALQIYLQDMITDFTVSIGIGKLYATVADLCRSYQEAKHALDLGRFIREKGHVTHFEELGIIRLLSHMSLEQLDDYYKEYLSVLIEYDEKNNTNFIETLHVYFQQNGDLNLTAEKLFQHANTLRYRLKKIEELLETDLKQLENRINLAVACKIFKMRKTNL